MLSTPQWHTALGSHVPDDIADDTVSKHLRAFLVQFPRELPYTTTEVAQGLAKLSELDRYAKDRLFNSMRRLRKGALAEWSCDGGSKKLYGRDVPIYDWIAPPWAEMPQDVNAAPHCPTCGQNIW